MEPLKLFFLGILVYVHKPSFFATGKKWFPELQDEGQWTERVAIMRKKFWRSFALVLVVIGSVVLVQCYLGYVKNPQSYVLRVTAATVALTATLGRAGWGIQSYKGQTVVERIDRGMYVLSQLGATVVLLFALVL